MVCLRVVSPLEMAAAYGTLANGGVYIEPTIFTTITSYDGQLLVKNTPEEHQSCRCRSCICNN